MPGPKNLDPSSSPRALLGAELRYARERAGLSQEELAQPLFVSGSFIGQLEAGTRRMHLEYARQIDEILGTGVSSSGTARLRPSPSTRTTSLRRPRRKRTRRPSRSTRPF